MNNLDIVKRLKLRLPDEENTELLDELINTAKDRILLRIGENEIPEIFKSILVDVVVKLYRRQYYEGISSESVDVIKTSFVSDVLSEYDNEFEKYIKDKEKNEDIILRKVRFI